MSKPKFHMRKRHPHHRSLKQTLCGEVISLWTQYGDDACLVDCKKCLKLMFKEQNQ